jgi:pyrimidine-nucleoside phosphorylase
MLKDVIKNGKALEVFAKMIEAQHGDPRVIDSPESFLGISKNVFEYKASNNGYFEWTDTEKVGLASMALGAGREKKEDSVDPSVGIEVFAKTGDRILKGDILAKIYYRNFDDVDKSLKYLNSSYKIRDGIVNKNPLVFKVIGDFNESV